MTATELGLPSSPIVDARRNLTSEWLNALSGIEQLGSLREAYDKIASINASELTSLLDAAEQALATILARPVPNNILASNYLFTEQQPWNGGITPDLDTFAYIPMFRQVIPAGSTYMNALTPSTSGTFMTRKDKELWTYEPSFVLSDESSWFTFTAITEEGLPQ